MKSNPYEYTYNIPSGKEDEEKIRNSFGLAKLGLINRGSYKYFMYNLGALSTILGENSPPLICAIYTTFNDKFYELADDTCTASPFESMVNSYADNFWHNMAWRLYLGSTTYGVALGIYLKIFHADNNIATNRKIIKEVLAVLELPEVLEKNVREAASTYLSFSRVNRHETYDELEGIANKLLGFTPDNLIFMGSIAASLVNFAAVMTVMHLAEVADVLTQLDKIFDERVNYYKEHMSEIFENERGIE